VARVNWLEFVKVWNDSISMDEVVRRYDGIRRNTLAQRATRLRTLGYTMKWFNRSEEDRTCLANIDIGAKLRKGIEAEAERRRVTMSSIVREALEQHLGRLS